MDEANWESRFEVVEKLERDGLYRQAVQEAATLLEEALRELYRRSTVHLAAKDQRGILDKADAIARGKPIYQMTLGQIVVLFQDTGFLNLAAQAMGRPFQRLRDANLPSLVQMRNRIVHAGEDVSEDEARFFAAQARLFAREIGVLRETRHRGETKGESFEENEGAQGLKPGDCRGFAFSLIAERKLDWLLRTLYERWNDLELSPFSLDPYRPDELRLGVFIADEGGKENPNVNAAIEVERDEEVLDTYLTIIIYAKRKAVAKSLATEAAGRRELRKSGRRAPSLDDYEWYVRDFPLSGVEALAGEDQVARICTFTQETFGSILSAHVLDRYLST